MKVLDKVTLRAMLKARRNCTACLGRGYLLRVRPDLLASKFREAIPCFCLKQLVRVEED